MLRKDLPSAVQEHLHLNPSVSGKRKTRRPPQKSGAYHAANGWGILDVFTRYTVFFSREPPFKTHQQRTRGGEGWCWRGQTLGSNKEGKMRMHFRTAPHVGKRNRPIPCQRGLLLPPERRELLGPFISFSKWSGQATSTLVDGQRPRSGLSADRCPYAGASNRRDTKLSRSCRPQYPRRRGGCAGLTVRCCSHPQTFDLAGDYDRLSRPLSILSLLRFRFFVRSFGK